MHTTRTGNFGKVRHSILLILISSMSSSWMAEGGVGVNWQFGETLREVNSDKWTHSHNIHRWPAKDEDNTEDNDEDKVKGKNEDLKVKKNR